MCSFFLFSLRSLTKETVVDKVLTFYSWALSLDAEDTSSTPDVQLVFNNLGAGEVET